MDTTYHIFLIILIVASLFDLLIPLFLGFKYPNYNHFYDTISTLGTNISPVKKWEGLNLILVGILFIVFAFGQRFEFSNNGLIYDLYLMGIVVFGIGCILAGIFPEDPKGIDETLSGKIHGISSGFGFIFLILCPFWAIFIEEYTSNKILNIVLLILSLLAFILFLISEKSENGIFKYTGLFQRLNLIFLYSCLIINYITLLKINEY
jgi:hypothetical protein